jgi:aryl-alcohol dehydrogenase-like predicted oxidoreductase
MELRQIGKSDLKVSVVGLGCNNFGGRLDLEGSRAVIDLALEKGVNFFDTADSYGTNGGSEITLGKVLGARRKNIILATKFGWPLDASGTKQGASRKYIMSAVEASLSRLNTDWIDLYQMHVADPSTPIEETLRALEDLVKQGKVRHIGCSNLKPEDISLAQSTAAKLGAPGFITCQDHYNLLARGIEDKLIPELRRLGMALIPYAPLASGLLTGKFRRNAEMPKGSRVANSPKVAERYLNDATWQMIESLIAFSEKRGHTLFELAIAWIASRDPVCSVIAGAMSTQQLDANLAAISWRLTAEDIAEVDKITKSSA